ncbi:MAG: hypothetical protein KBA28_09695 [Syntrophaceae bacterium]|jgi:hypothetical protein|nr:hypothetical protein [Syntrophaceae bacterium]
MIIQAIETYLQQRPKDDRPKHCFHPSSLHLDAKELYWRYINGDNDKKFESRILRIFDNGHAVHQRLQDYLTKAGILERAEIPVFDEQYEIRGHADGIVKINGANGVLEIKSMNANQFYSAYEPKPEHLIQVNVYMHCLNIPRACLLYECKDNQEMKEFFVKQDQSILQPILDKIKFVQECLKDETEPA